MQLLSAVAIIGLVLLQRGKGAEAGAGFGAGASGTVFGARGASTALSRATAIFAAIFMLNSLVLAYVGTQVRAPQPQHTLLDEADAEARKTPAGAGAAPAPARAGRCRAPAPAPRPPSAARAGAGAGAPK